MKSINIYKNGETWCYALFVGGEYDHSANIDVSPHASDREARAEISEQFPLTTIYRTQDVNE